MMSGIFQKKDRLTFTKKYQDTEDYINAFDKSYKTLQLELEKKLLEFKNDSEDKRFLEARKIISKWISNGGILPKKY